RTDERLPGTAEAALTGDGLVNLCPWSDALPFRHAKRRRASFHSVRHAVAKDGFPFSAGGGFRALRGDPRSRPGGGGGGGREDAAFRQIRRRPRRSGVRSRKSPLGPRGL